jgi:hypothetical protein
MSNTSAQVSSINAARTSIIVALIASLTSLGVLFFGYHLTERVRTDIAAQTLALEKVKVDIAAQTLALDRMKVDIGSAAQKTSEMATKIDEARLQLETRIAASTEKLGNRKIQIEDKRGQTEEIRLTPDFAKLSNEIRPNIDISCEASKSDLTVIRMKVSFKNLGAHKAKIVPTNVSLLGSSNQILMAGAIERIDNAAANFVLPGLSGSNIYEIILTQYGATIEKPIISITFIASTDQVAIDITKRLAKGLFTDKELQSLSEQTYTYNYRL